LIGVLCGAIILRGLTVTGSKDNALTEPGIAALYLAQLARIQVSNCFFVQNQTLAKTFLFHDIPPIFHIFYLNSLKCNKDKILPQNLKNFKSNSKPKSNCSTI